MFELIQELTEARMYKNRDTLYNKSARELGQIIFATIMMIEILRNIDPNYAKTYIRNTLQQNRWTHMRPSATDLHNLLAVINNQENYDKKIKADPSVTIPVLALRRYMRDIEAGRKDKQLDRSLFLKLQDSLKVTDSRLKWIRRQVADWNYVSKGEKVLVRRDLKNLMQLLSIHLDIHQHFKNILTSH